MKTVLVFNLVIICTSLAHAGPFDFLNRGVPAETLKNLVAVPVTIDNSVVCLSTDGNGAFYKSKTVGGNDCSGAVKWATPIKRPLQAMTIAKPEGNIAESGYVEISRKSGNRFYAKKNDNGTVSVVSVATASSASSNDSLPRQIVATPVSTIAVGSSASTTNSYSAAHEAGASPLIIDGGVQNEGVNGSGTQASTRPTDANALPIDGAPAEGTVDAARTLPPKPAPNLGAPSISTQNRSGGRHARRHSTSGGGYSGNSGGGESGNGNASDGSSCELQKDFPANSDGYCSKIATYSCGKHLLKGICADVQDPDTCKPIACARAFETINNDPKVQKAKEAFFKAQKDFGDALIEAQKNLLPKNANAQCVTMPPGYSEVEDFIKHGWRVDKYTDHFDQCGKNLRHNNAQGLNPLFYAPNSSNAH